MENRKLGSNTLQAWPTEDRTTVNNQSIKIQKYTRDKFKLNSTKRTEPSVSRLLSKQRIII